MIFNIVYTCLMYFQGNFKAFVFGLDCLKSITEPGQNSRPKSQLTTLLWNLDKM